jgi:predicted ATP-binding protein involved in virulence
MSQFAVLADEGDGMAVSDRKRKRLRTKRSNDTCPTSGSYFLSLELENVRCFSVKQFLDLSDRDGRPARWTVLLGENGTGKTTTLQILAMFERALNRLFEPVGEVVFTGHGSSGIAISLATEGISRGTSGGLPRFSIQARSGPSLTNDNHEAISYRCSGHCDSKNTLTVTLDPIEPPKCYAYGTGRRLGSSSLNSEASDSVGDNLFFEDAKVLNAEEWLLRLDYSASKASAIQERQKKCLKIAKEVLLRVLPDVSQIRFTSPTKEKPVPGVEFETPYGWVPLRQLGHGYRTMIAWVVDLTSRMVERYSNSPDPLAEPAVVLVDEIDLHLHPRWQRELIGFLTERFPNTQFIVTAHSPLIVQSAPEANIVLLRREGDHVIVDNHPERIKGWRVDQILTSDLFGLNTARPPDTEELLMRRKELLTKPRLTRENKREINDINARLESMPTGESFEQAKTMALIDSSLKMLMRNQDTEKP